MNTKSRSAKNGVGIASGGLKLYDKSVEDFLKDGLCEPGPSYMGMLESG
jgi:hypothetical protein